MPQPQTMREKINQIIDEEFFSKDDGENGQRALDRLIDLYTSQVQEAEERGRKEENAAWIGRHRCNTCGKGKEPDALTDMCANCFENE